MLYCQYRTNGQ